MKWCEFHKTPTHSTIECRAKQSLVFEMTTSESDACSNFDSKTNKGNEKEDKIINAQPSVIIVTTKIQKDEPTDPEYEE